MNQTSLERKKAIELRLKNHGIVDYKIQYLPYLDFDIESFVKPFNVGCRIMILSAVSLAAQQAEHRAEIVNWLKGEAIWEHVSAREKLLFEGKVNDQKDLIDFSWQIESAYVLAWSLGLVSELSESCQPFSDSEYDDFTANVPLVGDDLKTFLSNLEYIDKTRIIDENLFNELATTYFRDVYFNGGKNTSKLNKTISFERHKALNWMRRFMEIEDWDDTDTST